MPHKQIFCHISSYVELIKVVEGVHKYPNTRDSFMDAPLSILNSKIRIVFKVQISKMFKNDGFSRRMDIGEKRKSPNDVTENRNPDPYVQAGRLQTLRARPRRLGQEQRPQVHVPLRRNETRC